MSGQNYRMVSDRITDKFDLYDLLGSLVPGLVAIGMIFAALWWTGHRIQMPTMPHGVSVLLLTATGFVLGQVIQALGSLIQPFYYWTWRGRPSDQAFKARASRSPQHKSRE